jgi:glycine/D-amino acid oxidase-like deaminating enzyme
VALGKRLGVDMRDISPEELKRDYKLESKFSGRFTGGNGNFHPFKFVVGEVMAAIKSGVELHSQTKATKLSPQANGDLILETDRGPIKVKGRLLLANNAAAAALLPQLKDIQPTRSQIVNWNHVEDNWQGITATTKDGDGYGNYPGQDRYVDDAGNKKGTLHFGGGKDTPVKDMFKVRLSNGVYELIQKEAGELLPQVVGRIPVRTWPGLMAFMEGKHGMRMAAIGTLTDDPNDPMSRVACGYWCNGYGGTGCHKTGYELAQWALNGAWSDDVPEDVFGIKRLLQDEPLFDPQRGGPRQPVLHTGSPRDAADQDVKIVHNGGERSIAVPMDDGATGRSWFVLPVASEHDFKTDEELLDIVRSQPQA